jgi:hypothetical protein
MCFRTAVNSDFKVIRDDEKIVVVIIDIDFVLDKWFLFFLSFLMEPLENTNFLHLFRIDEVSVFPKIFNIDFYM